MREDAEALRRRLYSPGAEADDVYRYRAAGGGSEAVPVAVRVRRPRRRPRVRIVLVAAIAVLLVAAALGVARFSTQPVSTGPAPTPLAVDPADRQGFEQNLAEGKAAGIAAYLITTAPLPRFRGTSRFDTIEDKGVGGGVVTLAPVDAAAVSGRTSVFLVVDVPAQVGWSTLRRQVDPSGEERFVPEVHRESRQQAGILTIHTYRYASGDRPVELQVEAPDGVRWGAVVVFSD